jgi:four helix bundle protein
MQSAKSLRVYDAAEELAVRVYEAAWHLPAEERFALSQQLRRSAISVGSNIAEGCGRDSDAELTRFLRIALGSATELEFQLRIAVRLGLLDRSHANAPVEACLTVQRMLTRLIVAIRPAPEASRGRPKAEKPETEERS